VSEGCSGALQAPDLLPRRGAIRAAAGVGFIATNLVLPIRAVARFYKKRGKAGGRWETDQAPQRNGQTSHVCHLTTARAS